MCLLRIVIGGVMRRVSYIPGSKGQLYTGFKDYMGTYYWFVDGVRKNAGWRHAWGYTYYTDKQGRAVQGWQTINGICYYFGDNGTFFMRY